MVTELPLDDSLTTCINTTLEAADHIGMLHEGIETVRVSCVVKDGKK
jgi:hypothetical protein